MTSTTPPLGAMIRELVAARSAGGRRCARGGDGSSIARAERVAGMVAAHHRVPSVLALSLGRVGIDDLDLEGDRDLARAFPAAFPGP